MSTGFHLTPYAAAAPRSVADAVVALVGLPAAELTARTVATLPDEPDLWYVSLAWTVDGRTVSIDAFPADSKRQSWFRTAHAAWAYKGVGDPFSDPAWAKRLNDLKSRLVATDTDATDLGKALQAASTAHRPFARLKDESFRALVGGAVPSAVFWLGTRCDQDCGQCWQARVAPEPPPEMFATWLDECLAQGVKSITFSGGEPTLRPDLPALLRRTKAVGASVVVETNGMNLADESLRTSLRAAGVDCWAIALHASNAALSDTLTRTPGAFDRTVTGLRAVLADATPVALHVLVDRRNAPDLVNHARFVASLHDTRPTSGPGIQRVSYSTPVRAFDVALHKQHLPTLDEVRTPLTQAIGILRNAGIPVEWCGQAGFAACAVDDPAEVRRGLPSSPFTDRQDRTLAPVCSSCDVAARCPGVHRFFLEQHGGASLRPMRLGVS